MSWRVGSKVPINVYDGDRPVCQCHNATDALDIADAMSNREMLVDALQALLDAWWGEFSYFFGGDAESDARKLSDFESQPAVIAARAAVELARRFVPGGSGNPSGEPSADSSGTEQPKDKTK